jgi:hypothetical protein
VWLPCRCHSATPLQTCLGKGGNIPVCFLYPLPHVVTLCNEWRRIKVSQAFG